ncbi:hypothetical protein BJ085DRAFT_41314 [Dimargaris cristalligena]|uniref:Uncharacterized protein n=1 Tax=Dimargaris cristalligena TaxID=215637 RepID=A0A4P9ZXB6_9FUNG|nr:hypothetical protein BJ085DRAFT_41314 [Dimargaris cristalligena]|eukprot:RKP38293.1 hypothetical protein BJ085DRAFT_41314 [Dimargaris cristalligena]
MKEEHEDGYNSAEPEYEDGEAEEEEEEDEMNSQFELEERDLDADIERATDEIEYEYAESSQHVGTEEDDDADQTAHLSPQAPITSMDSFMSDEATPVVRLGASSLSFHMISPPAPGGRPLRGPPQHQRYITPSEAELSRIQPLGLPTGLTNDFSMLTATPVDSSGESGRGMGPLTISATSSGASSQFVTPTVTGPPRDPFDQSDNAMAPMYGRIGHNGSLGLPAVPGGGRPFAVPALPTRLNFRVGNQFVTPNNASASSSAAGSNNDDTDDHGAMSLLNDSCTLASDRTLAGGSHRVFSAHDETPSTAITPLTRISAGAPPIARPQFMPPPAFTASSSSSTLLSGPPPTLSLTASTPVAFSLVPNVTTGQDSPEVSTDVDSATVTPLPGASFARPGVAAPFKGFSLAALAESELDEYDGEDMVED